MSHLNSLFLTAGSEKENGVGVASLPWSIPSKLLRVGYFEFVNVYSELMYTDLLSF